MSATREALRDLGAYIESKFGEQMHSQTLINGELVVTISCQNLLKLCKFLRDDSHCLFSQLVDICGVDFPEREKRFEVVYNLLSMKHNIRCRVKVIADADTTVPSVVSIWPAAVSSSSS